MHTFVDPLRRAELTAGGDTAVVCGDVRADYRTLLARCRRLIGGLQRLGLRRGDRVAVVARNCHRYLECYLAVPSGGLVIVPLNARHTEAELRYAAEDAGARVLVTDRPPSALDDVFEHVVRLPDGYEDLLDQASGDLADDLTPADLAGLFYTGGTTGAAKGVMLTHGNLLANAWTLFAWARLSRRDRWLVVAPMFHAAGTCAVLGTVWQGARHLVLPGFEPAGTLDAIEAERATATLLVPTMIVAAVEEQLARPRDVSCLRLLSHGASPIATETLRRAHRAFPQAELLHLYGATETSPIATTLPDEQDVLDDPRARSCGQPAVGVQVRVVDSAGRPLRPGEVGEVAIKGPNVMRGYWRKEAETTAVLSEGWYRSGDMGRFDEHGYLYLVDRLKDMIVTGGENVYSTEVEDALYSHPAVLEAAVYGVPDERWGEAVHATVVTRTPVAAEALIEHCRARVAGYKVPKAVDVVDQPLPKSGAGKILKRELREPFWAGRDRRI